MNNFFEIDGSALEGGGQILRMSVAFSAIMGIPVRVSKIRAGRSKPGLAAQHMKGLQLIAEMCSGKLSGAQIGSTEIEFTPGTLKGGNYIADPGTAGSISLLLQIALPCALLADSQVILDLKGGTNAAMAPQIDFMTEAFRPVLEKFGGTFDFELYRRGYYPRGGGCVTVTVNPIKSFNNVNLNDMGVVDKIYGWSFVAGVLPIKMAHQMADGAKQVLGSHCQSIKIESYKESREMAPDNCNGIILVCETSTGCVLGGSGLGRRDLDPSAVGRSAADELSSAINCGACLDSYTQDQVIIFMALASGKSSIKVGEVTLHTKTAIYIAELLAKCKFIIIPNGGTNTIECSGIAYTNRNISAR